MSAEAQAPGAGTPLAAELAERGMTSRALARAAGVHENSVYAWAAGKATPTTAKAIRVAAALGVPVDRLFPTPEKPPRRAPQPRILPVARPAEQVTDQDRFALTRRLVELMARRELSPRALAEAVQLNRATIDRWLDGSRLPSPDAAVRAAEALDVPVTQLLPAARSVTPLRAAAAQRGWGPRQLARASGVPEEAVKGYLAGTRTPLISNANRLAVALDRPLTELFDLASPDTPERDREQARRPGPGPLTAQQILETPATGRDRWRDEAACAAPDADPEQWWPTGDDPALPARTTCAGCPVLGDCRDAYLSTPDRPEDRTGIWAGLPGGRLRAAARTRTASPAREPRTALAAAPSRETVPNANGRAAARLDRDRGAPQALPARAARRDPSGVARGPRDPRTTAASPDADAAPSRSRAVGTGIVL